MSDEPAETEAAKIEPRWRWHYRALMRLNGRLLDERDEHRKDMGSSLAQTHKDPSDTAADQSERNILFAELKMEEDAIAEVEAALQRIRDGKYGICECTGNRISADRLRAIPWTRFCREAAPRGRPSAS